MEWTNQAVALLTIVVSVVVAGGGFLLAYLTNSTRLMKRIDSLTEQNFKQQSEIFDLQTESNRCLMREKQLQAELGAALARINRLEKHAGLGVGEPGVGIVVADLKGIIRVFSPTLTPFLRWLPDEVVNKPLAILMPDDMRVAHSLGFQKFIKDKFIEDGKTGRDSDKPPVLTYALDKHGNRVAVTISPSGWMVGNEGLITAVIRERVVPNHAKE